MAKRGNWRGLSRQTTQVTPGVPNNVIPDLEFTAKTSEVLKAFMPVFVERLRRNLNTQKIGNSGDLDDSFKFSVRKGTDRVSANLRFNFYGRFVDMGVGKGTNLVERQTGRLLRDGRAGDGNRRKPKPWFTPQYIFETERLAQIMTETMAELSALAIGQDDVTLKVNI
jgi:hypothetical protein